MTFICIIFRTSLTKKEKTTEYDTNTGCCAVGLFHSHWRRNSDQLCIIVILMLLIAGINNSEFRNNEKQQ